MATPFARTLRSLKEERTAAPRLVYAIAILLGALWTCWFFLARIQTQGSSEAVSPAQLFLRSVTRSK